MVFPPELKVIVIFIFRIGVAVSGRTGFDVQKTHQWDQNNGTLKPWANHYYGTERNGMGERLYYTNTFIFCASLVASFITFELKAHGVNLIKLLLFLLLLFAFVIYCNVVNCFIFRLRKIFQNKCNLKVNRSTTNKIHSFTFIEVRTQWGTRAKSVTPMGRVRDPLRLHFINFVCTDI